MKDFLNNLLCIQISQPGSGTQDHAVGQGRDCQRFDVIRQDVIPPIQGGPGLRGADTAPGCHAGWRPGKLRDARGSGGRSDDVALDRRSDKDLFNCLLSCESSSTETTCSSSQMGGGTAGVRGHALHLRRAGSPRRTRIKKRSNWASGRGKVPSYSIGFWVARTIKGLGKMLVTPSTVTCALLPSLPAGSLGLRRSPVDFIGQHDLRHDSARAGIQIHGSPG